MPLPSLPVDSAISCSAQRPKLEIGSETTNVSLSRPRSDSSPIATPSHSASSELASWAPRSSASTSTPASAAGTSPKKESTE